MKKSISGWLAVLGLALGLTFSAAASAESGGLAWDKAPNKTNDVSALQNGAKLFVNYCLNCHSAAFMRYNRLQDIGITEQQIKDNLLFTTDKVGETMKANIDARQAKDWFGTTPPDLTLVARSRAGHGGTGADYLYTYLRTYYRDETKATGWNNSCSRASPCRTPCGNCRASAARSTPRSNSTATKPRCSRAGSKSLPAP